MTETMRIRRFGPDLGPVREIAAVWRTARLLLELK
jgi:hypothetical protein